MFNKKKLRFTIKLQKNMDPDCLQKKFGLGRIEVILKGAVENKL